MTPAKFRALRESLDLWSRPRFARHIGVPSATLAHWEGAPGMRAHPPPAEVIDYLLAVWAAIKAVPLPATDRAKPVPPPPKPPAKRGRKPLKA